MTLTIDLPPEAEVRLLEESQRIGIPVSDVAGRLLTERLLQGSDRVARLIADISVPIDLSDTLREAIYAD